MLYYGAHISTNYLIEEHLGPDREHQCSMGAQFVNQLYDLTDYIRII